MSKREQPHSWTRLFLLSLHCFCPSDMSKLCEHNDKETSLMPDCGITSSFKTAAGCLQLVVCIAESELHIRWPLLGGRHLFDRLLAWAGSFLGLRWCLPASLACLGCACNGLHSINKQAGSIVSTAGKFRWAHRSTPQGLDVPQGESVTG